MNLTNNSTDMETVVETFIIEETKDLIYDNEKLDKWNELVDNLGLKGQTKIITKDKSPIPFMPMNTSLINIFECLCPRKVKVEDYDVTPIPVELLDLIGLSKKENYFNKIEIWYDEKTKDPVVVGIIGHYYQSTWDGKRNKELDNKKFSTEQECKDAGANSSIYYTTVGRYLIGKWGDMKHSFEKLKEMAKKRYMDENKNTLMNEIKIAQRKLEDLESDAFQKFN